MSVPVEDRIGAAEMMARWREGPLHPDLEPYLAESEVLGPCLRHPLVYQVPYFLPGQANEAYEAKKAGMKEAIRKRQWHTMIFLHERPYRLDALQQLSAGFNVPNKRWWDLVGIVWTDSENIHQNLDAWEEVWASDRPQRLQVMDKDEKAALAALPAKLTVWRGAIAGLNEEGMSWTLDRARAEWFARRFKREGEPVLVEATVPKRTVLAHFLGRNEAEIVISTYNRDLRVVKLREVGE